MDFMFKKHLLLLSFCLFCVFVTFNTAAQKLKASLAQMPVHAISKSEGIQVELIKAISAVSGHDINIGVYSFARSVDNVIKGRADFHIPLIKNDIIPTDHSLMPTQQKQYFKLTLFYIQEKKVE